VGKTEPTRVDEKVKKVAREKRKKSKKREVKQKKEKKDKKGGKEDEKHRRFICTRALPAPLVFRRALLFSSAREWT
jgi:alpha-galactosidase/6-phospho-beta-glucosidase family protein